METELQNNAFNSPAPYACWACGAHISAEDKYCRKCGKGQGPHVHWYYKHIGIIVLSLLMGPFALSFVWRSPALSRNAKLIYTSLLCVLTWYVVAFVYRLWSFYQSLFSAASLQY